MKVVISRKGFDSSYGGCPSPIFPDGSILSLPIPSAGAEITYGRLKSQGRNVGQIVEDLTGGRLQRSSTTHLDPDLEPDSIPRLPGWRPAFGQVGGQLTHLRNSGVSAGDLFLFFGWFREVRCAPHGRLERVPTAPNLHMMYGWLQVDAVIDVGSNARAAVRQFPWLCDHPHVNGTWGEKNSIFIAKRRLEIPGCPKLGKLPGGGSFGRFAASRCLTKTGQDKRSLWSLPASFSPKAGIATLSLHGNPTRWTPDPDAGNRTLLDSAKIGQEFVLSSRDPGPVVQWLRSIFADMSNPRKRDETA